MTPTRPCPVCRSAPITGVGFACPPCWHGLPAGVRAAVMRAWCDWLEGAAGRDRFEAAWAAAVVDAQKRRATGC